MVLTTLMLTAGLLAIAQPQAESRKGWIVEVRGYTYHSGVKAKGWIFEVQGFTKHPGQRKQPKEMQPNRPKPVQEEIIPSVYVDDLRAYFNQLKRQEQIEAVETLYVDDLHAYFKNLTKQKP